LVLVGVRSTTSPPKAKLTVQEPLANRRCSLFRYTDKMRVLLVSQWFDPEPGATKGLPFAKWLQSRGHEVEVLTGFPNYPGGKVYQGYRVRPMQREIIDGVSVLRVPLFPSHDKSAIRRVLNYSSFALSASVIGPFGVGNADVCYAYHPPPTVGLASLTLKYFRRIPFVYHIADMWPETVIESGMLRGSGYAKVALESAINSWCSMIYRQSSAITVLSPGFKDLLVQRGVPPEKVSVIYNWTDEEAFQPVEPDLKLGKNLGLVGRFNVVYAGNLGPLQGLETVIQAAALLRDLPEIQVVIAGGGHEENRLKELAGKLSVSNVLFLGRRQYREMAGLNALSDVMLIHLRDFPFFSSTIPGKTQVALSSGRPVIMAVSGDAAAIIKDARAGLVCPPENPVAMADSIRKMYSLSPEVRSNLGRNGLEFYRREMSLDVGGARTEALLRQVASR
jgi:colanic acid biosynthesis glycosyl transferase WcaI